MARFCKISLFLVAVVLLAGNAGAQSQITNQVKASLFKCDQNNSGFCTELRHDQQFNGHYSATMNLRCCSILDKPGSGTNALYHLTLPGDPPVAPRQDGTGGTFNFQLHSTFWFGMVLCDPQSSPNFTSTCVPGTDANIFDNADPNAPDFIGHHPGSAFLELQFYPPGGLNSCSDPTQWCVAMVIFSFNIQDLTNQINNRDCRRKVGLEPSNFAFLTTTGVAQSPADPLNFDFNTNLAFSRNNFPDESWRQSRPGYTTPQTAYKWLFIPDRWHHWLHDRQYGQSDCPCELNPIRRFRSRATSGVKAGRCPSYGCRLQRTYALSLDCPHIQHLIFR
jgi:hypothetical protein